MAVDPYALCPCGSGKKLKFCCSDLVGEIEKIHRMIEGDQPRAALKHVEQALAEHPGRASLLDLKASLELSLGERDAARQTIDQFLAVEPNNATAHACHAIWLAANNDARAAVDALQTALALVDRDVPHRVYEAVGTVGRALLMAGNVAAAQAHLWFQVALSPKEDPHALEVVVRLNHYSGLPLMLREQLRFRECPADAPWKADADKAAHLADHGKWQQAVQLIDRLGQQYGADPSLVYNRAVLAGWLADDRTLVAGMHAFAGLPVPIDDAVDAAAIAQLLDSELKAESCDSVLQVYEIRDLDDLVAHLSSDPRVEAFDLDPQALAGSDGPRPRHSFILLDRAMPASGAALSRHDVPHLVGVISIFGRQTNRPERLELTTDHGPRFDQTMTALREAAGDALGEMSEERVVSTVPAAEQALNWRWHFPQDTPPALRRQLSAEERRAAIVERWPEVPSPALGGRSPRAAAADPALRIPLMATVLILEQGTQFRDAEAFDELRSVLGLPQPEPIHPGRGGAARLPLVRVPRLVMSELSDDDLVVLHRRAVLAGAQPIITRIDCEAIRRPAVARLIPPAEAYRRLIMGESDSERALALIDEARRHSAAAGESTAKWDLAELELHLSEGALEPAQAMLRQIEERHMDDPQVASALYRLLYEMGVIPPEAMAAPASAAEAPPAMVAAEAAADPGRIWTPDADRPAGGKKSSLWTPS